MMYHLKEKIKVEENKRGTQVSHEKRRMEEIAWINE